MSFELPVPKTRKEYFMAISAGGTPGTDFPARYEVAPVVEHVYHKYEETLEADKGTFYVADITDFVDPGDYLLTMVVEINGKPGTYTNELVGVSNDGAWANEDGYHLYVYDGYWGVCIDSETELSGDALNVVVETSWDDDSDEGTPLQPKTVEEAYYANLANISVSSALSKMQIKSRKDQYLNALINAADDGGDSNAQ